MPDYKEMYLEMVRKTEKAIQMLIDVQRHCEDLYIESPKPELKVMKQDASASNPANDDFQKN